MFETWKKLKYGARVLLSRSGGQPETIDINGRPTVLMHAGEGAPFVYLHSTLGEAFRWLPPFQTAQSSPSSALASTRATRSCDGAISKCYSSTTTRSSPT